MYAHEPGKIPVSPDTSHPRFPGIFVTFNRKIFLNRVRSQTLAVTVGKGSGYARLPCTFWRSPDGDPLPELP